jgi:hypothetical protein
MIDRGRHKELPSWLISTIEPRDSCVVCSDIPKQIPLVHHARQYHTYNLDTALLQKVRPLRRLPV